MDWHRFTLIAGAHFLALLSPGPDFFLIVRYALVQGTGTAALASLGIALANGLFIIAAISGFTLLRDQPVFYALLYWSGCSYLVWLGLRFWQAGLTKALLPEESQISCKSGGTSRWSALLAGFLSGILNPKNALFYLTLFTLIAGRNTTPAWQIACGIWMFWAVLAWDCIVSWAVGHPRIMEKFSQQLGLVHRTSALLLWLISAGMLWNGIQ